MCVPKPEFNTEHEVKAWHNTQILETLLHYAEKNIPPDTVEEDLCILAAEVELYLEEVRVFNRLNSHGY